jgi:hypothetical protein
MRRTRIDQALKLHCGGCKTYIASKAPMVLNSNTKQIEQIESV